MKRYFATKGIKDYDNLDNALINSTYAIGEQDELIFEQYKLYVEMADRVSSRRATANVFFLSLNTAIVALMGSAWEGELALTWELLLFPTFALVTQCFTWFWIIRSYRQLNTIKWAVVGAFEKHLPLMPYSNAEWEAADCGNDPAIYWPLSKVESIIPFLFGVTYIGIYLTLIMVQ